MKLKTILIFLACVAFFMVSLNMMRSNAIPKGEPTGRYSCVWESGGTYYSFNYKVGETAEESCEWKKDFGEDSYNKCLDDFKATEEAYDAGKCKPIYKQTHKDGDSSCEVEYAEGGYFAISCSGSNRDELEAKVRKMYKQ